MTTYADRPWLRQYRAGEASCLTVEHRSMLDLFGSTVARHGGRPAVRYFDGTLTFRDLDERSSALAHHLLDQGFGAGDRLALYTQNDPAFLVGLLGTWKAGGVAVAVNPMNKARELTYLLTDSGAVALLCLDELWTDVAREVVEGGGTEVRIVVTVSASDDQARDDARVITPTTTPPGTTALRDVFTDHAGRSVPSVTLEPDDVALLTYTSGTTGVPKGAMNTHGNLAFSSQVCREWMRLTEDDVILGIAPLFHITGMVGHIGVTLLTGGSLVLCHRFVPAVMSDAIREHRPTFSVGAVTAFTALTGVPGAGPSDWASFRLVYSGGAPIAPVMTQRFEAATGHYLHNIYGLTETTSPCLGVPMGVAAPVDPGSGALSVGVPVYDTIVRIVDDEGRDLPFGQVGEIVVSGPQVVSGYWRKPDATAENIDGGDLRTGDVGFMSPEGWFFLVDRKKDMINASGYKVWPREVEDVLCSHEAVREVAVVGVPDEYRGETVKAFVSLAPGASVTAEELIAWSKERMAAYKYPRSIEVIEDLPKTTTGKILRRELRTR
ncbi:class I adenylate-forming enzyme family protein [Mobilicoccus pelagius]|uniref:Long-chain fatty-acid--CoA ligase n=1 Tax=Mobilicoccus pelagius NBRC 104925 TaxID=1089455 RepID=H5UML6_9MICO|nr:AMP-binding protein [Mobilicoccus pelagius]GAB46974.1 long-chain fatty-acid--CoA ligase [Mobilicoccus pelagius NBRC 104925]